MKISINNEIFKLFPDLKLGVVVVKNFKVNPTVDFVDLLRSEENNQRELLDLENHSSQEFISSWRQAYSKFGAKPSKYKSSIEALLRRVLKGDEIPDINPIVNLYNYLSLKYHLPFGGEDMDMIKSFVELRVALGNESGKYLGSDEVDTANKGEVIYADELGFIVRRFNWREADRTKITEESENLVLVCEAINSSHYENLKDSINELVELLSNHSETETFELDGKQNSVDIDFASGTKIQEEDYKKVEVKEKSKKIIKEQETSKPIINTSSVRTIKKDIADWLEGSLKDNKDKIEVLETTDKKFGDYSTNIAMVLASANKQNPREVANSLIEELNNNLPNYIEKIEVAGPGFINIFLSENYLQSKIHEIIQKKDDFGKFDMGKGKTIMVEYGQPNTHKALHIGHVKSAISGLSIIKLFSNFGFNIIKANYYSDVGMHVAKCIWGIMKLGLPVGLENKSSDEKIKFIQEAYQIGAKEFKDNKSFEEEIRIVNKKIYSKEDNQINELYEITRKWSREHQKEVFDLLDVEYDREYAESEIVDDARDIVEKNMGKAFVLDDGAVIFRGEDYGLHNRVFLTKEDNVTYESKDLALAKLKFKEYKLDQSFIFTGVEQTEYFKIVIKALETIDPEFVGKYDHIPFGHLLVSGKKESSRSGVSFTGKDLISEIIKLAKTALGERNGFSSKEKEEISRTVGIGALRYMILKHPFHVSFSYDPKKALSIDGDSAPYIMYAYTRAMSIVKEWGGDVDSLLVNKKEMKFSNDDELSLTKIIVSYETVLVEALDKMSPHIIAMYLLNLATEFNRFYKFNSVLKAEDVSKETRILITNSMAQVLKNGLNILGIKVLERM